MPRYMVTAAVTISVHTEVDAKSPAAAKRLALERGLVDLCHQCAGGDASEEWVTSGELDGEPSDLVAEALDT
jgi:hypothetical protein